MLALLLAVGVNPGFGAEKAQDEPPVVMTEEDCEIAEILELLELMELLNDMENIAALEES